MPAALSIDSDSEMLMWYWVIRSGSSEGSFFSCRGRRPSFFMIRSTRHAMVGIFRWSFVLQWCWVYRTGEFDILIFGCRRRKLEMLIFGCRGRGFGGDDSSGRVKVTIFHSPYTV
ncbi:hypothetical protein ACJRO7_024191 [Eucalyptus globulus]|uniref:Uncharacterized protein n=1 Tax=Eucalyptus globulus TaxID=34317 RepID=A0ABD3KAC6_EUCGL